MTQRNVALYVVLSIVTCGLFAIYWIITLADDTNTLSGSQDISGGMVFLYSLITCGIYFYIWSYRTGDKIDAMRVQRGGIAANSSMIYLLLSIFGLSIVALALMQNELNQLAV